MTYSVKKLYYFAMIRTDLLEKIHHETAARPFSIHHTHVDEENTNALYLHCHPEAEFFFLEEGEVSFYVEGERYELQAGDGMFIPPQLVHRGVKQKGRSCDYSAVVFSLTEFILRWTTEGNPFALALCSNRNACIVHLSRWEETDRAVLGILNRVGDYRNLPVQSYELRLFGEILICFQELMNHHLSGVISSGDGDEMGRAIHRSVDYISRNYAEEMNLRDIAEPSGYSESHFCRCFKKVMGYSPFHYLNRYRVVKAAERLVNTGESITAIALACGFDDISYFNRVFRKYMSMAPGEYRARALGQSTPGGKRVGGAM